MPARTDPSSLGPKLSPELRAALARADFATFAKESFAVLKPRERLIWGGCLDVMCAALQEVAEGATTRLIITVPPRFLKSICGSVALPAYVLGHNPGAEVMCVSYAKEIAEGFGADTRTVMTSQFYKEIFDTRLKSERAPARNLRTTEGGGRRATSITGLATSLGAHVLIFDDAQKAGVSLSEAIRRSTNSALETTFISRQNDPKSQRIVIIMQRLHEDDFVGHALALGGSAWKVVNLPAIAEDDEVWNYETVFGPQTWKRAKGESLLPERWPIEILMQRRADSGEAIWQTQYQQRPTTAGGEIVKTAWFRRLPAGEWPQDFDQIVQSWDTAITIEQWSCFSVCTTWGIKDDKIYLINVFRKRLHYPDLKRAVLEQAARFGAHKVLIEKKASGAQLLQEAPEFAPHLSCVEINPEGDKQMRMSNQTALLENGFVYVPDDAAWLDDYLHELSMFPNGKYDDQVDSTSQFLFWRNNVRVEGWNVREYYRQESERVGMRRADEAAAQEEIWVMAAPEGAGVNQLHTANGELIRRDPDGCFRVRAADARPLLGCYPPWRRFG